MKALTEGMVFIASPKSKSAVLETIMKQFKMTDPRRSGKNYLGVTLVRMEEYRKPCVPMEAMRILQRLLKTQTRKIGDVKVETLVDFKCRRNLDDSRFFEKLYAASGVK